MEKWEELETSKVETIKLVMGGSPNSTPYSWLKTYPCKPINLIDNTILLSKAVAAGVTTSGSALLDVAPIYSLDIVRKDGNTFDIDRHLLTLSGGIILKQKEIHKAFPEHHSKDIPPYYNPN
jgi:hypothetical protein